ncbi:MAG TPA: type II toxin-antitoxin system RelE/ParE family toxin [Paraburkholderia sp.]|uniref:type II toxin-antitoxin system RelE family toxin n=1 Tax=Paraburkholderia sp. TaxID=1926495 RepID=UPI002B464AEB|nr:type II toxin-antitoxin system RelE/ParE family toxin [Paraburkholderia sp.]HKR43271.1 type II toxin-antitoxin system RelE/ParE family toxin [Paraburkholderia sp.]
MASYELVFKKSVAKDLRALPQQDVKRILQKIRALADDPRPPGCEKLSGLERYRVRQGSYRVVYEIEDRRLIVLIVKVAHRRDVYKN